MGTKSDDYDEVRAAILGMVGVGSLTLKEMAKWGPWPAWALRPVLKDLLQGHFIRKDGPEYSSNRDQLTG